MKRERSRTHKIEIYGVWLEIVVSGSILKSRSTPARVKRLGRFDNIEGITGLHCFYGRNFCILLNYEEICYDTIAHEVFHATVRIMEWVCCKMGKNHEAHAYLNGYITKLIYRDLKDWGLRAK